jgi:hypothetical protein
VDNLGGNALAAFWHDSCVVYVLQWKEKGSWDEGDIPGNP